jgi:hypothetical protein
MVEPIVVVAAFYSDELHLEYLGAAVAMAAGLALLIHWPANVPSTKRSNSANDKSRSPVLAVSYGGLVE